MAETFATLQAKIISWLNVDTTRLSIAGDLINMAQRELLRKHDLRFGETSDTFATADGDNDYDLPTGFSRPHSLWYTDPDTSAVVFVTYLPKDEFDARYPDATKKAKPGNYTFWGQTLYLGKTPDQIITINRNYYKLLADLSADGDSNDFTDNAWEAIFFKALTLSSLYMVEDARMPVWQAKAKQLEDDLVEEHRRARSVGRIPQNRIPS